MKDQTHEDARRIVELWLMAKSKSLIPIDRRKVHFTTDFIAKHKLGTRSRPNTEHHFDIITTDDIYVEVDDYGKHSHKSQKINDGIIDDFAETYLEPNMCEFFRLQKEEIVDRQGRLLNPRDVAEYLRDNLF